MAVRRMFSREVCEIDAFLDLPATVQQLYCFFGLEADDEGFLKTLIRSRGLSDRVRTIFLFWLKRAPSFPLRAAFKRQSTATREEASP